MILIMGAEPSLSSGKLQRGFHRNESLGTVPLVGARELLGREPVAPSTAALPLSGAKPQWEPWVSGFGSRGRKNAAPTASSVGRSSHCSDPLVQGLTKCRG